jgi:hypothetical protein
MSELDGGKRREELVFKLAVVLTLICALSTQLFVVF